MCGFVGLVSDNINREKANFALQKLHHRGPDAEGAYNQEGVYLGHKRLAVISDGQQPFSFNEFVMVYDGKLYNASELRDDLIKKGYHFEGQSDTEVLIKVWAEYGEAGLDKLNGVFAFAIWNKKNKTLFLCRDRLGVKPLFYCKKDKDFMVSSAIKSILHYFDINQVDANSLQEVLGLGPSHTPGNAIYKGVKELMGGSYLILQNNKITIKKYWSLNSESNSDSLADSIEKVRYLVEDSIKRQLVSDVPLCTFLSGGLDSTIITMVAKKHKPNLESYSVDYEDNEKYFKKNDFQVSRDSRFIQEVVQETNILHHYEIVSNAQLARHLPTTLLLKDYPGMADIDSSLYCFSKKVKEKFNVALSGECADEIFGGYPWFYRETQQDGFPWIRNLQERSELLNDKYKSKLKLQEYVQARYQETLEAVPLNGSESAEEKKHKQMFFLNIKWFMQNLLERNDRITMGASLEVRVPFADHRLVEYLYNVPWEYKFLNNTEKGLLRQAFSDLVPESIRTRKKNPYPKTFNPQYLSMVQSLLLDSLKEDSILHELFDKKILNGLISGKDDHMQTPWYGQLMTRPQLLAYLYQIHLWFKLYNLNLVE